jgi:hypothetical protein
MQIDVSPLAQPWRAFTSTPPDVENVVISASGDALCITCGRPPSFLHQLAFVLREVLLRIWRLSLDGIPLVTIVLLWPQWPAYLALVAFGILWLSIVPTVIAAVSTGHIVIVRELCIESDRWHLKTLRAWGVSDADRKTLQDTSGLTSCLLGAKARLVALLAASRIRCCWLRCLVEGLML